MLATAIENAKAEKQREEDMAAEPPGRNPAYRVPGRLGDPRMELRSEPRLNVRVKEVMAAIGADRNQPSPFMQTLSANSSMDEIAGAIGQSEAAAIALYENIPISLPEDEVEIETERVDEVIKGGDGQDMKVYIYRPALRGSEALPCVVYSHGGAMTIIPTMNRISERWCRSLAAQGLVVVLVDFRNAWTKEKYNHFPAGLTDCAAAVNWIHSARDQFNIRNIILEGESGGGNLAFAVALKANREGWIKKIDGVYGIVPYISNAYGWTEERKLRLLPSLVECNGYVMNTHYTAYMSHFYTPKAADQTNPLAWPYHASLEDMKGLPPHVLVMDELDPLRDEGVSYSRRLVEAGVEAKGSVNLGVPHGTSLVLRASVSEFNKGAVRDIVAFAKSL